MAVKQKILVIAILLCMAVLLFITDILFKNDKSAPIKSLDEQKIHFEKNAKSDVKKVIKPMDPDCQCREVNQDTVKVEKMHIKWMSRRLTLPKALEHRQNKNDSG